MPAYLGKLGYLHDVFVSYLRVPEHDDHGFRGNVIANSSAS
jgi:hypothetical protein